MPPIERSGAPLPYPRQTDRIARRADTAFIVIIGAGLCAFIAWASLTQLDKIARGSGRVIPQLQNQVVQHFEGGIVTEIMVGEGDTVTKGSPLLRVENNFSRSELEQSRMELAARELRLLRTTAEISGSASFDVPGDLDRRVPQIAERERSYFATRSKALGVQLQILDEQQRQKEIELSELRARAALFRTERDLIAQKLVNLRRLAGIGAVSTNELIDNERVLQQSEQRLSDLSHDIPKTEAALGEIAQRRLDATYRFRADAEKERSEAELQAAKLRESINALQDRSQRNVVTAPVDGVVNKLNVTTVGGVVKSGEPLLQIVPSNTAIAVEARLSPSDRAQVWPGLPAVIKISAYEFSTYGGLKGKVTEVSPDTLQDEKGASYFRVRLEADASGFGPDKPILPGMQADVDIHYGRQTILATLIRPVQRLQESALRQ
jgi:HlyD family type I secretion membrane fusion protein